jgi:hypothetical protein
MSEILRSNDLVLISAIEALFKAANVVYFVADLHISGLEGSIGAFPRRILVETDRLNFARRLLIDAGLGAELKDL